MAWLCSSVLFWGFHWQAAHCVLDQNPENVELARFYCFTQKTISKRLVLRQDPSVKRTVCKRCWTLLVPGVTSTVRQRRNGRHRMTIVRCLSCGLTRRFLNNPNHQLWVDQPEAQLENCSQPGGMGRTSLLSFCCLYCSCC
ncbi:ribonuclease P protein subunit p21 [Arapaima gigas]